ncbi:exosome complex protein Rrp42 [Candidatus Woesearchaeota archaeon]|nr:exosome complex protein Rrp42 [Candidatus Woesearchaeota archaeon]
MKNHIIKLLNQGIRLDGRKLEEFRQPLTVEKGSFPQAEGSARVKIGNTDVIVGIKLETMVPYPDQPGQGSIMVGAELLPMASPDFESGPPSTDSIELARVVDRGIRESGALDFKKLCITEGEKVWMITIDIVPVNADGNLFDAASLGAIAALQDVKFPVIDDNGKIDYKHKTNKGLPLNKVPIEVTVYKIGKDFLIDPSRDEEKFVDARLTIATLEDGTVSAFQKGGNDALTQEEIFNAIDIAVAKGKELRKLL